MRSRIIDRLNPARATSGIFRSITRVLKIPSQSEMSLAARAIHSSPAALITTALKAEPMNQLANKLKSQNELLYQFGRAIKEIDLNGVSKILAAGFNPDVINDLNSPLKVAFEKLDALIRDLKVYKRNENEIIANLKPQGVYSHGDGGEYFDKLGQYNSGWRNREEKIFNMKKIIKYLIDATPNRKLDGLIWHLYEPDAILFYLETGGRSSSLYHYYIFGSLRDSDFDPTKLNILKQYLAQPRFDHKTINYLLYDFVDDIYLKYHPDKIEGIKLLLKAGANPNEAEFYHGTSNPRVTILEQHQNYIPTAKGKKIYSELTELLTAPKIENNEVAKVETVKLMGLAAVYFNATSENAKKDETQSIKDAKVRKNPTI